MENYTYQLIKHFEENTDHAIVKIVYDGSQSRAKWFWGLKKQIKKTLADHPDIDLIWLNDALMTAFARWVKNFSGKKVVATFYGLDVVFPLGLYQKYVVPRFNKYADTFICISHETKNAAMARGIKEEKLEVILCGIDHDLKEFSWQGDFQAYFKEKMGISLEGKRLIVSMGRAVKRKGISWFASMVLPKLESSVYYMHIGPRSDYPEKRKKMKRWLPEYFIHKYELMFGLSTDEIKLRTLEGNDGSGRFLRSGYLPFPEVCRIVQNADLFIMPNVKVAGDMEGFGLVALEASILGCPVLTADLEGIKDAVIDGKNGKRIESGNVDLWVSTIQQLLNDPDLKDQGMKGRKYTLEEYNWEKMGREYEKVFEETSGLK